jgi:hypothetical protein
MASLNISGGFWFYFYFKQKLWVPSEILVLNSWACLAKDRQLALTLLSWNSELHCVEAKHFQDQPSQWHMHQGVTCIENHWLQTELRWPSILWRCIYTLLGQVALGMSWAGSLAPPCTFCLLCLSLTYGNRKAKSWEARTSLQKKCPPNLCMGQLGLLLCPLGLGQQYETVAWLVRVSLCMEEEHLWLV